MEFYSRENKSVATGGVRIVRGNLEAFCDKVTHLEAENRFVLSGNPRAVQVTEKENGVRFENEVQGDQIEILFHEDVADQIVVSGSAQGKSTRIEAGNSAPQVSYVKGRTMRLLTADEQVREILVEGNATSFYHLPPDEERLGGDTNEASGDTIRFFFEDAEVSRVRICGGVVGHYRSAQ
jgi:hypothetical protein